MNRRRALLTLLIMVSLVSGVVASLLVDETEPAERAEPEVLIAETVTASVELAPAGSAEWTFVDPPPPPPPLPPPPPPLPPPPAPTSFPVAHATGSSVALFDAPGDTNPSGSRTNPTHEARPLIMAVREQQGEWLRVALPQRPNGSEAWIQADQVRVTTVPNQIHIDLSGRRLELRHGDEVVMSVDVGVGTGRTPTPTGDFYLDVFNPLDDKGGVYGWGQLSVSGFSDVLQSFGGGNGQIAIHGTNNPSRVGSPVSNGCVRMINADIERLAAQTPAGTPVKIVA